MVQGAIAGLAAGGVYAVIAVCLTLMSQLVRVINFSQVAIGMFGTFVAVKISDAGIPAWIALIVGILVGALISALIGWIIATWLPEASTTTRSAVTVSSLLFLLAMSFILFGTKPLPLRPIVSGPAVSIAGVVISWVSVVMIAIAIVLAVVARIVLVRSSVGMRLRAIADRPTSAELLGVNVKLLNVGVWFVVGVVISAAVAVVAPTQASDAGTLSFLVIPGAAAALVGAFSRLSVALIGGILLGALQGALTAFPQINAARDWIPIIVIVGFLLWNQRKEVWDVAR